ncbi:E3 ubiquitin protein ligase RIE1 [Phalaenopsis equestris]|uniref:E3 ubiquitin protein ligase RIE1 n=1 Tax=Phalaenopsis equestris TaxID=78828 RepID=UPI0009E57296|nr:E3 ubiquitin protein ligase RIE1 [Phalaenopsis equestris]
MEEDIASPEPLLRRSLGTRQNRVAALFGRMTSRRGPQALVRETAARQLDERRADWAYSRPVVAVDIAWNISFAVVSASVIAVSACERPNVPVRVWIAVYALQCVLHVALVWSEYRRRRREEARVVGDEESSGEPVAMDFDQVDSGEDSDDSGSGRRSLRNSVFKQCESVNTMASFLWWIVGFYWVISGGEALVQNAPRLYWLAVVFLAFDVCFAIFCVALAFVIGIALCCCLPCIIAILYAIAGQEGASDADISLLPRYRYSANDSSGMGDVGIMIPISTNSESLPERILFREYAECCICLSSYEEGSELHALPCNHHFHSACITKWLKINATCPLCKFNILKSNDCD